MGRFEVETDALRRTAAAAKVISADFVPTVVPAGADLGHAAIVAAIRDFIAGSDTGFSCGAENLRAVPNGLETSAALYEQADSGPPGTGTSPPSPVRAL